MRGLYHRAGRITRLVLTTVQARFKIVPVDGQPECSTTQAALTETTWIGGRMAHSTLAVLSAPDFPQILRNAIDRAVTRTLRQVDESHLDTCAFVSSESRVGACDAQPCNQTATVHHLESEQEYCLGHFMGVSRG